MADGFQKSQGLECGCRSLVGAGRLQPVSAGAAGGMDQSWRVGAGTTGLGLHHLWCAASDVDGPRHSVVERACPERSHAPDGVADEARHSTALERLSPSPDAGQGGTLSWRAGTGSAPARGARQQPQAWLDQFRWEHNHVRPHEALGMQTPASVWYRSERPYDPHPPRWEYPPGAKVLKVSSQGSLDAYQIRWRIARALAGEWVQLD